jgi:hypothetical protein
MDWIQFTIFILGNMVFTLTLWLWNRTESNADRREMMGLLKGIQDEMRDFHGRLERQDAEFKAGLARQDAEFKSGLLLLEEKFRSKS